MRRCELPVVSAIQVALQSLQFRLVECCTRLRSRTCASTFSEARASVSSSSSASSVWLEVSRGRMKRMRQNHGSWEENHVF